MEYSHTRSGKVVHTEIESAEIILFLPLQARLDFYYKEIYAINNVWNSHLGICG